VLGEHNVSNALAASAVAVALGISNSHIADGLAKFSSVKGRLNLKQGINGAFVIDDTYNANPDSMKAALNVLAHYQGRTIFVMGDMGELGEDEVQMHIEIGELAKQQNISEMIGLGELTKSAISAFGESGMHFERVNDLIEYLKKQMCVGVTLLVKGSRFMKMERIVNEVVSNEYSGEGH
jgi:UDP-N-acetylmuramoyl-tripeptide--D-alanyl-D-alanine ligase